jgi:hypothetical protein
MLGYGDANTRDKIPKRVFSAYERSICSSSNVDFIKLVAEVNTSINQPFLRQNKAIINLIAFFC